MTQTPLRSLGSRQDARAVASCDLPTRYGSFVLHVYDWPAGNLAYGLSREQCALVFGNVEDKPGVLVRLHSESIVSEIFGSSNDDARLQLDLAMARIAEEGSGIVIYLRQEGRGVGLINSIRAIALQSERVGEVLPSKQPDARRYDAAAAILSSLRVRSIRLLTSNPRKTAALRELAVSVEEQLEFGKLEDEGSPSHLERQIGRARDHRIRSF